MSYRVITYKEVDGTTSIFGHLPNFYAKNKKATQLYEYLKSLNDQNWIHGKFMNHTIPRLIRWYGEGKYKFSGKIYSPFEYSNELLSFQNQLIIDLKKDLGDSLNRVPFKWDNINSVLINKYRDFTDSICAHSDNEPEFGKHPTIVSVNLGASRTFIVRRMTEKQRQKQWKKQKKKWISNEGRNHDTMKFELNHGDVLIMAGSVQDFWFHEIKKEPDRKDSTVYQKLPERKRLSKLSPTSVRFNLTFRPYNPKQ